MESAARLTNLKRRSRTAGQEGYSSTVKYEMCMKHESKLVNCLLLNCNVSQEIRNG